MQTPLATKPPKPLSVERCLDDVSAAMNRIRSQFDFAGISTKTCADLPEIKDAEDLIQRTSQLVLNGEPVELWREALTTFEDVWVNALKAEMQNRKRVA